MHLVHRGTDQVVFVSADSPGIGAKPVRAFTAQGSRVAFYGTREGGCQDVLVNNASRDDRHAMEAVTPVRRDERIALNLKHCFFAMQAMVAAMTAAVGGELRSAELPLNSRGQAPAPRPATGSWYRAAGPAPACRSRRAPGSRATGWGIRPK